jgi:hypothetical protein
MNATSETSTGTSRRAEQQIPIVLGVSFQFLSPVHLGLFDAMPQGRHGR